ncbi:MAG: hypothetical protein HKN46_02015 [Acidimicrobiia bacterium]|nr:hypothetical protein [Acidimicrobiia bacterium]
MSNAGGVVIDLTSLDALNGPNAVLVERFLRAIQLMRQDFNGKVLTIRQADLELLSRILEDEGQTIGDVLSPISANS